MKTIHHLRLILTVLIAHALVITSVRGIQVTSLDITRSQASDIVIFNLVFNTAPDFFSLDSGGRPADSFQFYIAPGPTYAYGNFRTLIRGGEIHINNDIVFRDRSPSVTDPNAGGWGSIRGAVPFTLSGNTLTFSAAESLIGVSPEREFSYDLLITRYGGSVQEFGGFSGVPDQGLTFSFTAVFLMLVCMLGSRFTPSCTAVKRAETAP